MGSIIVNADDFGLSPAVNAGVERAYRDGILTSATLLANAPAFDAAVALARANPGLGVGLHLNIVRGAPLTPAGDVPLLVDGSGGFRRFRVRRLTRDFLDQAEREYRAQFEKIIAAGVTPTHIDFEKHHAWQGPLYLSACRLAREYGVPAVRNLAEPVAWTVRRIGWPGFGAAAMAAFLRTGFQLGGGAPAGGLRHPDRLLGQAHIGGMDEGVWLRLIAALPDGVSEIMVHPGEKDGETAVGMGDSWLDGRRGVELAALVSDRVRGAIEERGIRRMSFRELAE